MKIRVLKNRRRASHARMGLRAVEWLFLLVGLVALDTYVWINVSAVLYQAYEDWAFDQRLRALTPSFGNFAADEIRSLLRKDVAKPERPELRPTYPKSEQPIEEKPPAMKPFPRSAVIGRLVIPHLQLATMVREGADAATLRRAVGHIPGTALPGAKGNIGLAGHRDTFFRPLRNIQTNDIIELQTESGIYRYAVESTRIVGPRDIGVLAPSGSESLTLVTCYPFYYVGSAPKRFIVRAALIPAIAAASQRR